MARNFYKNGGSYYYADNNQKILDTAELQRAASPPELGGSGGKEVADPAAQTQSALVAPPADRNIDLKALESAAIREMNGTANSADQANLAYARQNNWIAPAAAESQESVDAKYNEAVANNPVISELTKGGSTLEEIINALSAGDLTGIVDWNGQPFSAEDQQAFLTQANEENKAYYEALQAKDTADAESAMAQKQADYQDYLINSGQQFEADKSKSDQQAANQGVLFSGSRVQREQKLERAYTQDQESYKNRIGSSIGTTARNFQYDYGDEAAEGLSKYYNLGGNTYNAKTAQGGVTQNALSSAYNPSQFDFQGTRNTERSANSNTRAAGYLWNKGNKLLATGSNNQF